MKSKRIIVDGYLYEIMNTKIDYTGQRYKMEVRKYWIDFYSRKTKNQYGVVYKNISIFISPEVPIVIETSEQGTDAVISALKENWLDVLDYALNRLEPSWIIYSEGIKTKCLACEQDEAVSELKVSLKEFEEIRKVSPYSTKENY